MADEPVAEAEVLMTHEVGLHARPSVALTKAAKGFSSRIALSVDGGETWVDAKSIVRVMAARAPRDTVLRFRAEGPDAEGAVAALSSLVENDFNAGA